MNIVYLVGIVLIASISPLLTFAHLWQIKEWRIDRLLEHFRSEGVCRQLFGVTRPAVFFIFILLGILGLQNWYYYILIVFGFISILQCILKKQPTPVLTVKAIALLCTSFLITLSLTLALNRSLQATGFGLTLSLTLIPLLQPFVLLLAWILFYPIDTALKTRIRKKAQHAREQHPHLTVIGITGSVGKTTTKELLKHLLSEKNMGATPDYVNAEIGVARWITTVLSVDKPPDILIVEMGAYRQGEIARICSFTQPVIGIVTAIGKQHLALFKTQEALCSAKAELIESLPTNGKAYLNADSTLCAKIAEETTCAVHTIGTGGTAQTEAYDIEETATGLQFRCGRTLFSVAIQGTHNVTNVLLAIAVARDLGVDDATIAKQLRSFSTPSRTFSLSKRGTIVLLNDTHNASPSSFRAAIAWARNQPSEGKVLLTSGLQELGEAQDSIHIEMGALASTVFTRVIFLQRRNAKYFEKGFGKPVELFAGNIAPISKNSLLVCIGRMPESTINRTMPL
jgi:UDP-N-acetylmuramoyl-tripeptide--D-alanyl-D-alanine ligase